MWEWSDTKIWWRPVNLTLTHCDPEHPSEKDNYYKNGVTSNDFAIWCASWKIWCYGVEERVFRLEAIKILMTCSRHAFESHVDKWGVTNVLQAWSRHSKDANTNRSICVRFMLIIDPKVGTATIIKRRAYLSQMTQSDDAADYKRRKREIAMAMQRVYNTVR